MTYIIFASVAIVLFGIARLTGLTYNTINILAYYLLLVSDKNLISKK